MKKDYFNALAAAADYQIQAIERILDMAISENLNEEDSSNFKMAKYELSLARECLFEIMSPSYSPSHEEHE